jgi:uncharacterized protein (DUF305 family)
MIRQTLPGGRASRRPVVVAALLAALPLGAQGMPAGHAHPADPARTPAPAAGVHPADVRFMTGMIGHHAQALVMTGLLETRSTHPGMRLLAERIAVSQRDEIAAMQAWLRTRGQAVPVPVTTYAAPPGEAHAMHGAAGMHDDHAGMPGMLTRAQLDSLAGVRGTRFDRLFLRYMIAHHDGAITMVRTLFATPGAGQDSQLYGFAADVDADQQAEIRRMRALLAQLPAERRRR